MGTTTCVVSRSGTLAEGQIVAEDKNIISEWSFTEKLILFGETLMNS